MLTTLTALCSAPRQASGFSKLSKFDGVVRTGGPHNVGSRGKVPNKQRVLLRAHTILTPKCSRSLGGLLIPHPPSLVFGVRGELESALSYWKGQDSPN